ncbi:MAG: DoxX family protein [Bacteroidetes bacterium CHB5]|nr:DoxX family protein [Bacteroidetes bacterium CHB5]
MKKQKTIFWISTTVILLWEGIMPLSTLLFAPTYATVGTRPLGYPDYFAYALIICKVFGVLAIVLPRIPQKVREWAYAGLTFNLVFAALSHTIVDGNPGYIVLPLVFLGILALSYYNRTQLSPATSH